ncbi:hypothetical protein CR194_12880 [Salipaludibacillus keqinensis]|uniref:Uncharacterized protein n=1 Tax=Salipaludibacillus keqinensis TaxID=2045207 RepID=A0A323TAZ2_9BACI|nr:hypothetical protein [Salipaludibacillus keqinensis]PYZ92558.1 hypothetical protein CR194_12880 [Salipaludibacillus keqinensis]
MVYHFGDVKVEETTSNMISPEIGTVVFECSSNQVTPFAVTIERRGDRYTNTAKGLLGQKVENPQEFDEFLREKAQEVLKKKFE